MIVLPDEVAGHLRKLGHAIDIGQRPTVFDGGVVGFGDATESEVMKDVAARKEAGPQSGSRQGRRARARRAHAPDYAFRSDALELAHGAIFRKLAQHYDALALEDRNGLWAAVSSRPLGQRGPEVHFLIAVPTEQRVAPRAWAFAKTGPGAALMSLKHTNFPDASICAFTPEHRPWPNRDGLLGLVDIYVLWTVRKLHRDCFGWWPGPQLGPCAHYRLREFDTTRRLRLWIEEKVRRLPYGRRRISQRCESIRGIQAPIRVRLRGSSPTRAHNESCPNNVA